MTQPKPAHRSFVTIQALRAVAALLVVVHHASMMSAKLRHTDRFWENGAAGVDIFFVISGFVIILSAAPLAQKQHPARTFLLRRLRRLVPMYWIVTSVELLLTFVAPTFTTDLRGSPLHVISSYFFWPTYIDGGAGPILSVGWTLNFEMLFYLLVTLALALRVVPPVRFLVPVILCLAASSHWAEQGHLGILTLASPMLLEFLYGVLIAQAVLQGKTLGPIVSCIFIAVAPVVLFTTVMHHGAPRCLLWGLPAAALVAGSVGLESFLAPRIPSALQELGDSSYSLYLIHALLLPAIAESAARLHVHGEVTIALLVWVSVLVCLLCGELSYRLLERPLLTAWPSRIPRQTVAAHS